MSELPLNKRKKLSKHTVVTNVIIYTILILIALMMLFPLYYLINLSLKTLPEFWRNPTGLVQEITFDNYVKVFKDLKFFERFFITFSFTAIACVLNLVVCVLLAFPISRNYFKGSNAVFTFVLVTMFLPGSLLANIVILNDVFHVYGTPIALIIMWVIGGIQMNTFMLVGFFKSIPKDLDEAAFVDGCGYFRYVFTMVFPLITPIAATLTMLKAIACWNDFLGPLIYMTDPNFKTLSTGLYAYMGQFAGAWNLFTAAIFIVALPMIIFYIFGQKYIIKGIVAGSVKG